MEKRKEAGLGAGVVVDAGELALINRLSRKELTEAEVYVFTVRLCDNEIDRDGERFSGQALEDLAEKFVGKSGVFDHQWSAKGQAARIYRAQVVEETGVKTGAGDGMRYVKGWAYMLRTEGNRDLIAEIEGGIKKEVSVGCAVERSVCSVCGEDIRDRDKCRHVKGRTYNGKLCWAELDGVSDAYEWSFVAVPAQTRAGVMKQFGKGEGLEELEREAALGRKYLEGLRKEVVRLGGLAEPEMAVEVLKAVAGKLGEGELLELKRVFQGRAGERWPLGPQLTYRGERKERDTRDGAFLI